MASSVAMRHPIKTVDPRTIAPNLLAGWAMVRRDRKAEKVGSIHIPDSVKKPTLRGELVGLGPAPTDKTARATYQEVLAGAKIGDRVHVHGNALVEARLEWEGDIYDIVQVGDICAVEAA